SKQSPQTPTAKEANPVQHRHRPVSTAPAPTTSFKFIQNITFRQCFPPSPKRKFPPPKSRKNLVKFCPLAVNLDIPSFLKDRKRTLFTMIFQSPAFLKLTGFLPLIVRPGCPGAAS